ncbi:hypothetical protein GQ457_12G001550 [Hibiscus cannabinus]
MEGNMDVSRSSVASAVRGGGGKEAVEKFEPGVYITYIYHNNAVKIFKRVRFGKRKFTEQQAGEWWNKNKDRVFLRYTPIAINPASVVSSPTPPPVADETGETAPSQT